MFYCFKLGFKKLKTYCKKKQGIYFWGLRWRKQSVFFWKGARTDVQQISPFGFYKWVTTNYTEDVAGKGTGIVLNFTTVAQLRGPGGSRRTRNGSAGL
jgi:hypothetical protein